MIASLVIPHLRPLLSKGVALGLAGLLAACGSGSDAPPVGGPPPAPGPTPGVTYDVISLNPRGETYGVVEPKGINADGMVAGYNAYNEPVGRRAFLYDGKRVIELGTFGGENSAASGINRCGQVTGWAETADGRMHAFLYDGTLRNIETLGGLRSGGNAINDCGAIAGVVELPGGVRHGFVYDGAMRDIGTFPGGTFSSTVDINSRGIVAGTADLPGGANHAFIYDSKAGTGLQDLGTLGGTSSSARIINDAGQVAGSSHNAAGATHAFRYSGGVMQDLGTFDGTGSSEAVDINAAGVVIGNSTSVDYERRGFVHDGTTMRDLGRFTEAVAINASGQVVGAYAAGAMSWTAEEGIVNLNTRLHEPPAGLQVARALAVSDNGSIVALANTGLVLLKVRR